MNISPINVFRSYQRTSFKGNNSNNCAAEPTQPNQSMQNNSPDFFIPTEAYLNMYSSGVVKDMENQGLLQFSPEELSQISTEFLEGADFTEVLGGFLASDAMIEKSVKTSLFGLKQQGAMLSRSIDPNKKSKVPMFVNITPDNFAKIYTENMNKFKNVDTEEFTEQALGELIEGAGKDIQSVLDVGMAIFQDEDYMESIKAMQEGMLKALETTYKDDLKEALEAYSNGLNCMLYGIIENSAKRSPKDVVNLLANNVMVYTQPKITDNGDGTSTLTYATFGTIYEVTRNNANGDYIKAEGKDYTGQLFSVDFRKDGTLKKLDYRSNVSNTNIVIELDSKNSKFRITQDIGQGVCQRTFNRKDDGSLELADLKVYTI